jgi:Mg/Co/Ni transporter MgtE
MGKELLVALLLGITMAIGVAAVASFRALKIIAVVSLTMDCVVLAGSIVGLTLSFIFTRFSLDPATASAPLITRLPIFQEPSSISPSPPGISAWVVSVWAGKMGGEGS